MNKRNLILSIGAGLLGGAVSSFLGPVAAHAQSEAPQEIRAQRFTLVNQAGIALGTFSFDNSGRPEIVLRDPAGHQLWSAGGVGSTAGGYHFDHR